MLIVGQGLAGSMLAMELWKRHVDFLVMAPANASAASSVAAGLYFPLSSRKLSVDRVFRSCFPNLEKTYQSMEETLGLALLYKLPSVKLFDPSELDDWHAFMEGDGAIFIDSIEEHAKIPGIKPGLSMAVISHSGYLDVAKLVETSRKWLEKNNLWHNDMVHYPSIRITSHGIVVNGKIEAEKVVFCEGAYGINNPWFGRFGLSPNKGEIMVVYAPRLCEGFVLRRGVHILPLGKGYFHVGATYSRNPVDDVPSESGLQVLCSKLGSFTNVPYKVVFHKAGMRPAVKDRTPLLGRHPEFPALAVFNGLGSKGVMQAAHWAPVMANWLLSDGYTLPAEVDVSRYHD